MKRMQRTWAAAAACAALCVSAQTPEWREIQYQDDDDDLGGVVNVYTALVRVERVRAHDAPLRPACSAKLSLSTSGAGTCPDTPWVAVPCDATNEQRRQGALRVWDTLQLAYALGREAYVTLDARPSRRLRNNNATASNSPASGFCRVVRVAVLPPPPPEAASTEG